MSKLVDAISLENDVFRAYAFWTAVIVVKMVVMSLLTGKQRFATKTFANPEDASKLKAKVKFGEEDVERVRRAHRNDLENCIPFILIGLFYVLTSPDQWIAINVIRAAALGRILHTIAYLNALQPWRAIGFFICLAATIYMSFKTAVFFY